MHIRVDKAGIRRKFSLLTTLSEDGSRLNDDDIKDTYVDKCTLEDLKFEWGWLEYEGFLDMPEWLEYLRTLFAKSKMMSSFVDRWIRYDRARRSKCSLSLARSLAHTHARTSTDTFTLLMPVWHACPCQHS